MSFLTRRVARRLGPVGVALTAYDIWKRLPEKDRAHLIAVGRKQGLRSYDVIKRQSAKIQSRIA